MPRRRSGRKSSRAGSKKRRRSTRVEAHIPNHWVATANNPAPGVPPYFVHRPGPGHNEKGVQILNAYRAKGVPSGVWGPSREDAEGRRIKAVAAVEKMAAKKSTTFDFQDLVIQASEKYDSKKAKALKKLFPFVWDLIPKKGWMFFVFRREKFMDREGDERTVFGDIEVGNKNVPGWTQDEIAFNALKSVAGAIADPDKISCALSEAGTKIKTGIASKADAAVVVLAYFCAWIYGRDCRPLGCAWTDGKAPVRKGEDAPIDSTKIFIPLITKGHLWNDKMFDFYNSEMHYVVEAFGRLDPREIAKQRLAQAEINRRWVEKRARNAHNDPNYQGPDAATGSEIRAAYENAARRRGVHDSRMDGANGID